MRFHFKQDWKCFQSYNVGIAEIWVPIGLINHGQPRLEQVFIMVKIN